MGREGLEWGDDLMTVSCEPKPMCLVGLVSVASASVCAEQPFRGS
jgi:hypothetical protein